MGIRTLYYIPIIHTNTDLGGLGERVRQAVLQEEGLRGWQRRTRVVDQLWTRIERAVTGPGLLVDGMRVYQDGLPVCGREEEIVRDLARAGSRNHRLLLRLMELGARIMGTESPSLLTTEYALARRDSKNTGHGGTGARGRKVNPAEKDLLEKRDAFIAGRINTTLGPGESGILFIGMLHDVTDRLDEDIRVSCPVERPATA